MTTDEDRRPAVAPFTPGRLAYMVDVKGRRCGVVTVDGIVIAGTVLALEVHAVTPLRNWEDLNGPEEIVVPEGEDFVTEPDAVRFVEEGA